MCDDAQDKILEKVWNDPEGALCDRYDLEKNPQVILSISFGMIDAYIERYIKYWAEHAPRQKISEHNDLVNLTPYYEKMEQVIKNAFAEYLLKRDMWLEKVNRFRMTVRLPKISIPPILVVSGI